MIAGHYHADRQRAELRRAQLAYDAMTPPDDTLEVRECEVCGEEMTPMGDSDGESVYTSWICPNGCA